MNNENSNWEEDEELYSALKKLSIEGYKQKEILDFVSKDFSLYSWSLRTLQRRLNFFGIKHTTNTARPLLVNAIYKELAGPGRLLGYRAMHNKVRQVHGLAVGRDRVHSVMKELDPEGLTNRRPCAKQNKPKKHFVSRGPNFVHSLDGHDKMMGFQNHTFPIAIYGCIDTCSRKILWIKVWTSNSNPNQIARFYLEYLIKNQMMSTYLRMDRGTETGTMATLHAYLRQSHEDMDPSETIIYGPSTSNQVGFNI